MRGLLIVLCAAAIGVAPARISGSEDRPDVQIGVPGRVNGEASIAANGRMVAVAWSASSGNAADVFVAVSQDGGRTFRAPVRANDRRGTVRTGGEQAPRVAFAPRFEGATAIVVVWTGKEPAATIRMARSEDGGRTFGPSITLDGSPAPGNRGWASLAVDGEGRAHVMWLDHRAAADSAAAGEAHHHSHEMAGKPSAEDGVARAQRSALYYAGGAGPRQVVTGVCYCCKTAVATGPGGALFAAWRHVYPGNVRDIAFASSRDGGRTFGVPLRVSRDDWQIDGCPEDGPALAVGAAGARGGTIHLAWPTVVAPERKDAPGAEPYKALFYSSSRDGAAFAPRVQISEPGHNIAHPQVVVAADGTVAVLWDELVNGARRVRLRTRKETGAFGEAMTVSGAASATYPVAAVVDRDLAVAWRNGAASSSTIAVRRVHLP